VKIFGEVAPLPSGLREAALNALIHRDSFDIANLITTNVYDDHIWLCNPGGLPEDMKKNSCFWSRSAVQRHYASFRKKRNDNKF